MGGVLTTIGAAYQVFVVVIAVIAFQNEWYDLGAWALGTIIVGAVIAGVVTHVTEEWATFPIVGGAANMVGTLVGIMLRIQYWFG